LNNSFRPSWRSWTTVGSAKVEMSPKSVSWNRFYEYTLLPKTFAAIFHPQILVKRSFKNRRKFIRALGTIIWYFKAFLKVHNKLCP
jgi:hypothetical protein